MSAKQYFSYIRVSTLKQGQNGTSLAEQQAAIERYAQRLNLQVVKQFEEQETAAKRGRPVFSHMLGQLRKRKADGVIMHKIDRSARNWKDWADLQELVDQGVEVHFINDNIDLNSRSGRLSADIQAVVAIDYIRNLREETKKGFYGRLKQGLYPMPAPVGYVDNGAGQAKTPDPIQGSLVKTAFELYATGNYGLRALFETIHELGLRNRSGSKMTLGGLAKLLHNPFYIGLIRVKSTGEMFSGQHEPIVPKALFDRVQEVFYGKAAQKIKRHDFLFKRQIICAECNTKLIGEIQKGYVYYRCHTNPCPQKTIREENIARAFQTTLKQLVFNDSENEYLKTELERLRSQDKELRESQRKALEIQLDQVQSRSSKLADAYVDGVFDKETYLQKKNNLLFEEKEIKEKLERIEQEDQGIIKQVREILELANKAYLSYKMGVKEEKREMFQIVTSNCSVKEKTVLFKLNYPFELIAYRQKNQNGGPSRNSSRTLNLLLDKLIQYFREQAIMKRRFIHSEN